MTPRRKTTAWLRQALVHPVAYRAVLDAYSGRMAFERSRGMDARAFAQSIKAARRVRKACSIAEAALAALACVTMATALMSPPVDPGKVRQVAHVATAPRDGFVRQGHTPHVAETMRRAALFYRPLGEVVREVRS